MTSRMSACLSGYGSWPLYEAAMNGGNPQAISVSPCWSLVMFWIPAPGTTLMLKLGSLFLTSSTKPPACAYQPPPSWPAVQVRFRSEEHTSELQSRSDLVCRLLLEKKKKKTLTLSLTEIEMDNVQAREGLS